MIKAKIVLHNTETGVSSEVIDFEHQPDKLWVKSRSPRARWHKAQQPPEPADENHPVWIETKQDVTE